MTLIVARPACGAALLSALIALAACVETGSDVSGASATPAEVTRASTAADLAALGAERLGAAAIRQRVVGRTMTEVTGGWTWEIRPDGTHASQATDGSWGGVDGTWQLEGDRYCAEGPEMPRICRDIWVAGNLLRLSLPDGTLAGWTVRLP